MPGADFLIKADSQLAATVKNFAFHWSGNARFSLTATKTNSRPDFVRWIRASRILNPRLSMAPERSRLDVAAYRSWPFHSFHTLSLAPLLSTTVSTHKLLRCFWSPTVSANRSMTLGSAPSGREKSVSALSQQLIHQPVLSAPSVAALLPSR